MKQIIAFLLGIGIIPVAHTQDEDLRVVASAGSSFQQANMMLDWTLGEVAIASLEAPSMMVTQGFHQPVYTLVSVKPLPEERGTVLVYPNPFSEELSIGMAWSNNENGIIQLSDMNGRVIWKKPFLGKDIDEKYNTGILTSGPYVLNIIISENSAVYAYQLFKIQ